MTTLVKVWIAIGHDSFGNGIIGVAETEDLAEDLAPFLGQCGCSRVSKVVRGRGACGCSQPPLNRTLTWASEETWTKKYTTKT